MYLKGSTNYGLRREEERDRYKERQTNRQTDGQTDRVEGIEQLAYKVY